ncbi:unnamed protein product [Prunus armeniaca]|uniref:Uncharacterized protein n=1 Tax=Prunus armeniaca TaxID=36596 RepID=A0A6J5XMP6_PRUAR|nr:unnamed protein product [Prunus armeniaca]
MDVMEMKSDASPTINFNGKDLRKLFSAYHDVRMYKNISMEVEEEKRATPSDIAKIRNAVSFTKFGAPVLSAIPPGMLNAAENTTVAIMFATSMHEFAVFFIHDSPLCNNPICSLREVAQSF